MNDVEMLKKLKELLDNEIITQEEFDKKKCELLAGSMSYSANEDEMGVSKQTKPFGKPLIKARMKKVIFALAIVTVLIIGGFGINKIFVHNQRSTRADALKKEIQPIMDEYGLAPYTVKYEDYHYVVYAECFESLTNGEALECLTELENVSIDDPCSDDKIGFDFVRVHPGLNVEYSYSRVSSAQALFNMRYGGEYAATTPGLYCDQYGGECIYECEN